jgi:hypothetical protein
MADVTKKPPVEELAKKEDKDKKPDTATKDKKKNAEEELSEEDKHLQVNKRLGYVYYCSMRGRRRSTHKIDFKCCRLVLGSGGAGFVGGKVARAGCEFVSCGVGKYEYTD